MFPLAAIGAGFGQFAEQQHQQQQDQVRTLMLQMQLADFKRKMDAETRANQVDDLSYRMLGGAGGGAQTAPIQGLPQGSPGGLAALSGPVSGAGASSATGMTPGAAAFGEYGGNQTGLGTLQRLAHQAAGSVLPQGYRLVETSGSRPGARVAGTGGVSQHALDNALDLQIVGPQGPIPNTGEDTTGLYGKLALAMRQLAPPDIASSLGWGGNFTTGPANGPRDLMHFDLGGDRGRYGTLAQMAGAQAGRGAQAGAAPTTPEQGAALAGNLTASLTGTGAVPPGGTQVAQAGPQPTEPPPVEPRQPPTWQQLMAAERQTDKTTPSRTLAEAAQKSAERLQGQYKLELERYKVQFERWKTQQSLAGEAASRGISQQQATTAAAAQREAERHNPVVEDREWRELQERIRAGTATDADRKRGRELEEGRLKVSQQQANTAATRAQAAVAKTKEKTDLAALELKSLITEAERLAALAATNPNLTGGRGMVGRTVGGVTEQITGGRLPGVLGGQDADKFESDMRILREALQKPLQSQHYASKHATEQLAKLVPAIETFTSPSQVAGALRNISRTLQERLHNMEAAAGAVADDVSRMTDDEIRRAIGGEGAAPAAQQ